MGAAGCVTTQPPPNRLAVHVDTLDPQKVQQYEEARVRFVTQLRVAQAQLVGWLEGLFHGIQASMVTQQMAAQAQLEQMRRQLEAGGQQPPGRAGAYL